MFFLKRDERGDVGVMMGKELEKCRESFFSVLLTIWQSVYLYSHLAISMKS